MEIENDEISIPEIGIRILVYKEEKRMAIYREGVGDDNYQYLGFHIFTDKHPEPEFCKSKKEIVVVPFDYLTTTLDASDDEYLEDLAIKFNLPEQE